VGPLAAQRLAAAEDEQQAGHDGELHAQRKVRGHGLPLHGEIVEPDADRT
jgi:hypothetical protein